MSNTSRRGFLGALGSAPPAELINSAAPCPDLTPLARGTYAGGAARPAGARQARPGGGEKGHRRRLPLSLRLRRSAARCSGTLTHQHEQSPQRLRRFITTDAGEARSRCVAPRRRRVSSSTICAGTPWANDKIAALSVTGLTKFGVEAYLCEITYKRKNIDWPRPGRQVPEFVVRLTKFGVEAIARDRLSPRSTRQGRRTVPEIRAVGRCHGGRAADKGFAYLKVG